MNSPYATLPVPLQNLACTWAGWQRHRARFTPHFYRILNEWEHTAHAPLESLYALQWHRLRALVERARAFVPHYRRLDLPPAVPASDPRVAIEKTLATLPILEKTVYAEGARDFVAEDIPGEALHRGKTSGTTGTALPLWYSAETLAEEYATVWRMRRACGVTLADPHLSFGGQIIVPFRNRRPPFWRQNHWGHQALFSLYHMSPENLKSYVDAIHTLPARYAQGYPSSLHLVGLAMLEAGRPLPPGRLSAVFTSSESLLAFQRETIEQAFCAPVRDRYGTSEFCISMTACREGRLHVDMEFGIVEVIVEEENDDWERGPILATGLANDATPFLRYRVGDVGTRCKTPCPCGRPGDVFLDVDGRLEDYVMTPEGRLVGRLDHVFKDLLDVAEAQVVQESKEAIRVLVVPRADWSERSERALRKEIRSRLGERIGIEVEQVAAIPREPNGKFRAVRSSVGRNAA